MQLEKARAQQWRPSTAKEKKKIIHVIQSEKFYHHSFDNASYAIKQLNQISSLSLIFFSERESNLRCSRDPPGTPKVSQRSNELHLELDLWEACQKY